MAVLIYDAVRNLKPQRFGHLSHYKANPELPDMLDLGSSFVHTGISIDAFEKARQAMLEQGVPTPLQQKITSPRDKQILVSFAEYNNAFPAASTMMPRLNGLLLNAANQAFFQEAFNIGYFLLRLG